MPSTHAVEQHPLRAIACMMGAVFMLSTMDVAFKHLVEHYSSLQVAFLRCAVSAPLFAAWILAVNRSLFRTDNLRGHSIRALFGFVMLLAVGECFREMPLADAYAIFFAAPLLMTLLSGPMMKEPAGKVRLAACAVGFLGVLVVLKPGTASLISYGSAMALLAVVCYAFVALLMRSLGRHEHTVTIAFWYTLLVGLASGVLLWGNWRVIEPQHWPWIAVIAITGTLGQVLITAAFRRASAAIIAPFDYMHMFWAVTYGWIFWGDLPGSRTWLGAAIIVASGLFVLYREHRLMQAQNLAEDETPMPLH